MVRTQQRFLLAAALMMATTTTTTCTLVVDAFINPSSSLSGNSWCNKNNALFKLTTAAPPTTTTTMRQRRNNNGPMTTTTSSSSSSSSLPMSLSSITMPSRDSFSMEDMVVIQEAYEQWCDYYTKPYTPDIHSPKLLTFAQHFDMAEQYIELTGSEVALNQYADMTYEEHQALLKLQQSSVSLSAIQDPKLFFISIASGIGKGGKGIGGKGSAVTDESDDAYVVVDEKEAAMQAMFAAAKARAAAKQQGTDPAKAAAEANKKKAEDRKARIAKRKQQQQQQQQQQGGGQTTQQSVGSTTSGGGSKAPDRPKEQPQWGYQVKYQEINPHYSTTPLLASTVRPQPKQQLPKTPSTAYSWLAKKHADEYGLDLCDMQGTGPQGHITVQDVEKRAIEEGIIDPPEEDDVHNEQDPYHGKMKISIMWLAQKKAEELGIDYRGITGTGPNGRIEVKDVEDYAVNEGRKLLGSSDGSSGSGSGSEPKPPKKKKGGLSVGFQKRE